MSEDITLEAGDDRPIRYIEDDPQNPGHELVVYRASAVGSCIRALVAAARNFPAAPMQDSFREILDEGTRMESTISGLWDEETGYETINSQGEIELEIGEIDDRRVIVRAHMDGMSSGEGGALREYKKFRPSTWDKFLRQGVECGDNYPWQVAIMMHGGPFEACEFVGGKYLAPAEYTDAHGYARITEESISEVFGHTLTTPPIPLNAIKKKIAKVERLINEGFDPKEVECMGRYPCAFYKLHDEKGASPLSTPQAATLPADDRWLSLVADYNGAKEEASRFRKEMDNWDRKAKEARATILGELQLAGVSPNSSTTIGDFEVKWTETPRKEFFTKAGTTVKLEVVIPDTDAPEAVKVALAARRERENAKKVSAEVDPDAAGSEYGDVVATTPTTPKAPRKRSTTTKVGSK